MCQLFALVQLVHKNHSARPPTTQHVKSTVWSLSGALHCKNVSKVVFNTTKTSEFKKYEVCESCDFHIAVAEYFAIQCSITSDMNGILNIRFPSNTQSNIYVVNFTDTDIWPMIK